MRKEQIFISNFFISNFLGVKVVPLTLLVYPIFSKIFAEFILCVNVSIQMHIQTMDTLTADFGLTPLCRLMGCLRC